MTTTTTATTTVVIGRHETEDASAANSKPKKLAPPAAPASKRARPVDHPLVAWLLENGCIVGLACLHHLVIRPASPSRRRGFWVKLCRSVAGGFILIEGSILAQKVLTDRVYAHIPYFNGLALRTSRQGLLESLRDWARCNLPSHVLGSVIVNMALSRLRPKGAAKRNNVHRQRRSGPLRFLARLAVARVVADVTFYTVHRALHSRWLYGPIHKRHHEHKAPALVTNFHFTFADLVIEGFLPLLSALGFLEGVLKVIPHPFEIYLIALYIQWYEIGSHSGKAMPTVTYFPPFAPLYRRLLGDVDARNVEFHHLHHEKLACNYGITQWLDHALGTARLSSREDEKQGQ